MALISHFKLNGNLKNETGNGDGIFISGEYISGVEGKGFKFTGSTSGFDIPVSATNSATGSLAITFWAKVIPNGLHSHLIVKAIDASSNYNINIHFPWYSNNFVYWDIGDNGPSYNRIEKVLDDKYNGSSVWRFFVFQHNIETATQQIYIDGRLWHSGTGKTQPFVNSSKPALIGSDRFQGAIDDLRIYDNPLTISEIKNLYYEYKSRLEFKLNTNFYHKFFDSSDKRIRVRNYNVQSGHGRNSKYSAYFDGDSDTYLRINLDYTPSSTFTWCGWVMKNRHTVEHYPIFMSFNLPYFANDGSSSPFRFSYRNSASSQVNITGTTIPALNTWYHICVTQDGSHLRLYVNGNLESSTSVLANPFDNAFFDIGRHLGNNSYRIWGRVEDVRLYEHAITQEEINAIINPNLNNIPLSIKNNGDIAVKELHEEVEWELWNNWVCPSLDGSTTQFDNSIGSRTLSSVASMQSDGWTTYLTNIDATEYFRKKGFSQQFYSGSPIGYIQKNLPSNNYDMVRIKWANWYSGTSWVSISGTTVQDLVPNEGLEFYTAEYSGTPALRLSENGIYWISEIWVGRKKENEIPTKIRKVKNNGVSINLHGYSQWQEGTGSTGNFSHIGQISENLRRKAGDPWGKNTIIWNTLPDSTSNDDGGWNYTPISIDRTKMYRYSVWVRRNNTNNGTFYHGCNGYGTTNGVIGRSDGAINTNPYFYITSNAIRVNTWTLVVGHIWPAGSGTGSNHPNSGVYYLGEGRVFGITQDYVWHASSTTGRGRSYLYYTTSTAQRQRFAYPTFEICDGSEAPIEDLITGNAYDNFSLIPENKDNIDNGFKILNDGSISIGGIIKVN